MLEREVSSRSGSSFFFSFFRFFSLSRFSNSLKNQHSLDPVGPHLDATDPPGEHVEEYSDLGQFVGEWERVEKVS